MSITKTPLKAPSVRARWLPISTALVILSMCMPVFAQKQKADEEAVVLSPFVVEAKENKGYLATTTLAGTRIRTELGDLGAAISVVTKKVFEDTGAVNAQTILQYAVNMEV